MKSTVFLQVDYLKN